MKFIPLLMIFLFLGNMLLYGLMPELSALDRVKINLALALVYSWRLLIDGNFRVRWSGALTANKGVLAGRFSDRVVEWVRVVLLLTAILVINAIIVRYDG